MKDYELVGSTNLFGLDDFGQPVGANPLWGALAGTIFQTGGAIAIRALAPSKAENAELLGAGIGALVGGIMIAMPNTRAAGWAALAVSLVSGGLRFVEQKLPASSANTAGIGLYDIERQYAFGGNGLGLYDIERQYALGHGQMPTLVGNRPELVGGPTVDHLSKHFGATLFGSN